MTGSWTSRNAPVPTNQITSVAIKAMAALVAIGLSQERQFSRAPSAGIRF